MKRYLLMCLIALLFVADASSAFSHSGHSNRAPWDACDTLSLSDACSWDHHDARYRGTCRGIGGDLMCVRNQPIIKIDEANAASTPSTTPPTSAPSPWLWLLPIFGACTIGGVLVARKRSDGEDV